MRFSQTLTDFQKSIWQECSQRLPRDAALVGQKDAAAWVRKTLDELSFEKDTEAFGEQKASEMRDLHQAGHVYNKCLDANARSLALATAEPAETVAKAVFAACGPQRVLLEWGQDNLRVGIEAVEEEAWNESGEVSPSESISPASGISSSISSRRDLLSTAALVSRSMQP